MGIQFYGGDRIQKGRGIGGLLRLRLSGFRVTFDEAGLDGLLGNFRVTSD